MEQEQVFTKDLALGGNQRHPDKLKRKKYILYQNIFNDCLCPK